ncbi:MAG: hypothetical protein MN733_35180, partial [Nitrososphaera sp.]|nr:hypothetical protein [Nitrososphaera sp.]
MSSLRRKKSLEERNLQASLITLNPYSYLEIPLTGHFLQRPFEPGETGIGAFKNYTENQGGVDLGQAPRKRATPVRGRGIET